MTTLPPAGPGRNIVLTGFMGTGKTTVGRLLAAQLDFDFIDTDAAIEDRHGPIHTIFAEQGERAFRAIEHLTAAELADRRNVVIATGGRMMLDPANVSALSRNGRIFCLVSTAADILERVRADSGRVERPLLAVDDPAKRVADLLNERAPAYRRFAQISTYRRPPIDIANELVSWATTEPVTLQIGQGDRCDAVVGPALLPLLRSIARIEGPLVMVTNESETSAFLPQCPVPDHLIILPTGGNEESSEPASRIVRAKLVACGVDRSATIVSLGGQVTIDATATATADLRTQLLGDQSSGQSGSLALVHCPTALPACFDRQGQPSMVLVDVAILQNEHTRGDLQALVAKATQALQETS